MAKKKATTKKKPDAPASAPPTKKTNAARSAKAPGGRSAAVESSLPRVHVYRHEIGENPSNAPLVIDLPIAAGRGEDPSTPSFVGFTAQMSEEYWQDQFAFRIVALDGGSVRVMVSRVDKGPSELGWGVRLTVHVLVVDSSRG